MDPRVLKPLVASGLCALGILAIGLAVFDVDSARSLDVRALNGFMGLGDHSPVRHGASVAQFAGAAAFAAMVLALVIAAAVRRRPRLALAVAAVPVLSGLSAEVLKRVTAAPRGTLEVEAASWPSGHVAAMTSFALCLILVVPARFRPLAAVVAWVGTVGIAFSVTISGAHMPSDALAGVLLAGMWTALAVAALRHAGDPLEQDTPSLALLLGSFAAVALGGGLLALALGGDDYAAQHAAFAVTAALIAAAAAAATAGTAWHRPSARGAPPAPQ
jgi:membrane-associated phospholipid phosphatase